MRIVIFTHPDFLHHQSMPRFARMLITGMQQRGHQVETWSPKAVAFKIPAPKTLKKWLGYIDQFVLFPMDVGRRLKKTPQDTLFVFADQALGPWIPLVSNRPHVIHCHDFLAQKAANKQVPELPIGWTGRQYQALIREGFSKGKNFISVSHKTREDLHSFLPTAPLSSETVYNGMNQFFSPQPPQEMRAVLSKHTGLNLEKGYILHVGGNLWYKNRIGIIEIYNTWRSTTEDDLPLLLVGEKPNKLLRTKYKSSPFQKNIYFLSGLSDELVRNAYSGASVFLYPSLAEGFGWPIAEAMASGCPVITTGEAPMTEVAGEAAFLIPRRPYQKSEITKWSEEAAKTLNEVVNLSPKKRQSVIQAGLSQSKKFDTQLAMDQIAYLYQKINSAPIK